MIRPVESWAAELRSLSRLASPAPFTAGRLPIAAPRGFRFLGIEDAAGTTVALVTIGTGRALATSRALAAAPDALVVCMQLVEWAGSTDGFVEGADSRAIAGIVDAARAALDRSLPPAKSQTPRSR